jgi:hypothetical protein
LGGNVNAPGFLVRNSAFEVFAFLLLVAQSATSEEDVTTVLDKLLEAVGTPEVLVGEEPETIVPYRGVPPGWHGKHGRKTGCLCLRFVSRGPL